MKARKAFERINPDDKLLAVMLQWIEAAKYSKQWQTPEFIPHPATWLNQRRWEDDVPPLIKRDAIGANTEEPAELSPEYKALIEARAKDFDF